MTLYDAYRAGYIKGIGIASHYPPDTCTIMANTTAKEALKIGFERWKEVTQCLEEEHERAAVGRLSMADHLNQ
jgi:hypothetical protein